MNQPVSTPICDFARRYAEAGFSRLHTPGHKGRGPLGAEALDITEIAGADSLYEADGIIAASEANATALFGSARTLYSTEGSSQCIRAMLYLAMNGAPRSAGQRPVALAARNAHKAFLFAAALCDFDVEWLWPAAGGDSLCACPVSPAALAARLAAMQPKPFCVYVTSPDYLGGLQDIAGLAAAAHEFGVPLLVDNAHGAYLKFLPEALHPIDLGADLCCDSAHKTLPVLTGGAYLHISPGADPAWAESARQALALFGSTSPSYLILESLDAANAALAGDYAERLAANRARLDELKRTLAARGFAVRPSEPMKLALDADGPATAALLRAGSVECEYADAGHVVLMFSADSTARDFDRVERILQTPRPGRVPAEPELPRPARRCSIREAIFAPSASVPVAEAEGRVCAAPVVSCPPAIPIAVSGEVISREVVAALRFYGLERVQVLK